MSDGALMSCSPGSQNSNGPFVVSDGAIMSHLFERGGVCIFRGFEDRIRIAYNYLFEFNRILGR